MTLELRHADGCYGRIQAVRDISLSISVGGTLTLLGRNGAGKSTVLRLLSGMLLPAAGEVLWNGDDITRLPAEERVRLGIVLVPEGRGIFPALSVQENLDVGAYVDRPRVRPLAERRDGVYDTLPRLRDLRRRRAGSLSGGEQQLLAIGRALMTRPKILLLDEPSLGLAPLVVDTVYEVLRSIVDTGIGVVVVEQHVGFALELCQQVIGLDKGAVAISGPSDEVKDSAVLRAMYMAHGVADDTPVP